MKKNGIDVSKWQGKINWEKVRENIDFAILKAGYGSYVSQKDETFEFNYSGCKQNNIPVGAYWYSYAVSPEQAVTEAKACMEVIKDKQFEYPIYFDIEEKRQLDLGKEMCSKIVTAFCTELEKAGYWVGVYSSKNHLENYLNEDVRNRYAVWVAHYGISKTTYKGQYGIWQYSDKGSIYGINGNVDVDECTIDYPTLIKNAGKNGFKIPKPTEIKAENPIEVKVEFKPIDKVENKTTPKKGDKISANPFTLYISAYSKTGVLKTGNYYLYDGQIVNGKYRITNDINNCGKAPIGKYVSGWIDADKV